MPDPQQNDDLFRRLVAKTKQPGPAVQRPAPATTYTRDIAARGSAAVADRAKGLSFDRTQGTQALDWSQHTGLPVNDPTQAYMDWYGQQGFQPQNTPIRFGQTKKGAYAGFKTEGELKAAVTGRADQDRMAARDQAQAQFDGAANTLDQLGNAYDTQHQQVVDEMVPDASSAAGIGLGHREQGRISLDNPTGAGTHLVAGDPRDDTRGLADAERVKQLDAHSEQLNQWLATSAQPSLDDMATARQIGDTPLREFQQRAGAEYGIDPNITAGWFPESGDVTDYTNQRNLQSIDDYGVPYSDFQGYLNDQQQQQTAAAKQQTVEAAAAAKKQTADEAANTAAIVDQATGLDASQLAQAVNMTPTQVAQVVSDPTYQQASTDLESVLMDPSFDPTNKQDIAAVNQVMDSPAIRSDPQLLAILLSVYSDYLG